LSSSVRSPRSSWQARRCTVWPSVTTSRNLIRVWVEKYEAGVFDEDARAADMIQEYEARIAALERLVGKQALELEFLKGASKSAPRRRSATTSVVAGPVASASPKDAD
jgi:transposase